MSSQYLDKGGRNTFCHPQIICKNSHCLEFVYDRVAIRQVPRHVWDLDLCQGEILKFLKMSGIFELCSVMALVRCERSSRNLRFGT